MTTEVELRRAPPQKGIVEKRLERTGCLMSESDTIVNYLTSPTCQGNSPRPASSPPTILVLVFLTPHAQEMLVGVGDVVVVSGGLVTRVGGRQHP